MEFNPFTLGTLGLATASLLAITAIFCGIFGWKTNDTRLTEIARRAIIAIAILLSLTSALLVAAFVLDRFELSYVAYNSSRTMPIFYKFSAFWGSLDGSMLLWAWLLACFSAGAMLFHKKEGKDLLPIAAATLGAILLFFTMTILLTTNPFDLLRSEDGQIFLPPDGLGLNPLLQNPSMVIHPPTLYLGFTGFTIPFAFAVAMLVTGNLSALWLTMTRRWTLIAWLFLTLGNILGANWAYVELGWGGYWGWDPVENAALMPWFTGTAFLHSIMMQEKKDMLKAWNVLLIFLTFWLTIFGTFLTRSGVVSSVHAFSNGTVGPIFLGFLMVLVLGGVSLIIWRWEQLKSKVPLQSIVSREGAFLLNNWAFIGLMFATLWGTIFPILNELVTDQKITVGAPFFNKMNAPLAIFLLILLAVGPFLAWKRVNARNFRTILLPPLLMGLLSGILVLLLGIRQPYAIFIYVFIAVAMLAMLLEFWRGARARQRVQQEFFLLALWRLVARNQRRYGGYIVHFGVLLVFIGISGNMFAVQTQTVMSVGQSTEFVGYRLTLTSLEHRTNRNYDSEMAIFEVTDLAQKKEPFILWPEKRFYHDAKEESSTEVAIYSTIVEDLYLIYLEKAKATDQAVFRIHINPLVQWIWIGTIVMALGTLIALQHRYRHKTITQE